MLSNSTRFGILVVVMIVIGVCAVVWLCHPPLVPEVRPGERPHTLADWLVVGPLTHESARYGDAATAGNSRAPANDRELLRLIAGKQSPDAVRQVHTDDFLRFTDHLEASAAHAATKSETSMTGRVFYAACALRSFRPAIRYVMMTSDSPVEVWLNGKLVARRDGIRGFRRWDSTHPLRLKRGYNLLVVRLDETASSDGTFALRVEPDARSAARTALQQGGLVLSHDLIEEDQTNRIRLRGVPGALRFTASVRDSGGHAVQSIDGVGSRGVEWTPTTRDTAGDVFEVCVTFGDTRYQAYFAAGNADALAARLWRGGETPSAGSPLEDTVAGLRRRWEILQSPRNRKPHDAEWQRKALFVLRELAALRPLLETGAREPVDEPGLHLRSFRSDIDGQAQYYRTLLPPRAPNASAPSPLFVMLATPVAIDRPFLESVFIARQFEAEALAQQAAQWNGIVLWPGYRSMPAVIPCELAHLDEAIHAVEKIHPIDHTRVYLLASCAAAAFAMEAASHWPGRFAAIGLLNPTFRVPEVRVNDTSVQQSAQFVSWRTASDPIGNFLTHGRTPIVIVHDGIAEPGHGDLEQSLSFIAEARAANRPAELRQPPRPAVPHFHVDGWDRVAEALQRHKVKPWQDGERSREDGLWNVFGTRFIVVTGSGGSTAEQARMNEIAERFRTAWRDLHFHDCVVRRDTELDAKMWRDCNLVLVGSPATNAAWRQLEPELEVTVAADAVRIAGRKFSGNVSFQALATSAVRAGRRYALLGATDVAQMDFSTVELSHIGWFDFAVWQHGPAGPRLVTAELYSPAH